MFTLVNRRAVANRRAKDTTLFEAIQHAPDGLARMNQSAFYAALAVSSCSSALCPAYNADDLSLVDDGKAFDPVLIGPPNSLSNAPQVAVIAGLVMTSGFNSMGH